MNIKHSVLYSGGLHLSFTSRARFTSEEGPICNFAIAPTNLGYSKYMDYFDCEKSLNNSGYFFNIATTCEYMKNLFTYILKNKRIKIMSINSLNYHNFRRYGNNYETSDFIYECSWMNIKIIKTEKTIKFIKSVLDSNLSQNMSTWFNIRRNLEFIDIDKDSTIRID